MFNTDVADTRCKALYRAVLETPADDTIRLIYCDALDERGIDDDAERAEFIRLQIAAHNQPRTVQGSIERMNLNALGSTVLGRKELDWRRVWVCGECRASGVSYYSQGGADVNVATCARCNGTGWEGILCEREDDTWDEQSGRVWGEFKIPAVWSRGFISGVTVPLDVFMPYDDPQWVRRLFLQWPIQSVTIDGAEPGDNSRVAAMHEEYIQYRWYSGEFGNDITRGYIPKPLFDIIKQHTLMTPGRDGALRALDMACVIWGRERAGLPFVDPRDWVRHS